MHDNMTKFVCNVSGSVTDIKSVKFFLFVTIVIISDVQLTNLYYSCLVVMPYQTMPGGMKLSITGIQNSHG